MAVTPHWPRAGLSGVQPDRSSGGHVSAPQLARTARSMSDRSNGTMPASSPLPLTITPRSRRERTTALGPRSKIARVQAEHSDPHAAATPAGGNPAPERLSTRSVRNSPSPGVTTLAIGHASDAL